MPETLPPVTMLVTRESEVQEVATRFARARSIALDVESNGLFAYRARLCTIQIAAGDSVAVIDALAAPLAPLASLLASNDTRKIVHDIAFDARILAEANLRLWNVLDTSIAARMLGRPATGLASLLSSELGVTVDKRMQHHDWAERPLDEAAQVYLANDVLHLETLAERLWSEVEQRGIAAEVEEETRYRLAQSTAAAGTEDPRLPYLRLKGIERVSLDELPILRRLAEAREEKARELDVPPYKVLTPDVLFAIARSRPRSMAELASIRGATDGRRARSLGPSLLRAVARGIEDRIVPDDERASLERPRQPASVGRARRAREQRLIRWRKLEAKARGVDEQVVLPGHCLQDLANIAEPSLDDIARVPGIGAFRVERDGAALLAALASSEAP